ncbi:hypothetical protein [Pontibacter chitinilyticus]|uniref:hypothetical protein n=1 Tax=Pontibacter chitinilyticus TaxID=2674989 RepID=UPI00321BAAB8
MAADKYKTLPVYPSITGVLLFVRPEVIIMEPVREGAAYTLGIAETKSALLLLLIIIVTLQKLSGSTYSPAYHSGRLLFAAVNVGNRGRGTQGFDVTD